MTLDLRKKLKSFKNKERKENGAFFKKKILCLIREKLSVYILEQFSITESFVEIFIPVFMGKWIEKQWMKERKENYNW